MQPNKDNIVQVDFRSVYDQNMIRYSLYSLYSRYVPDIRDGLKPVQRRIVYAMWNDVKCVSKATKRKSANVLGMVIAKYHSHGDTSVYDAMKCLTNWFEIKMPLVNYDSNSGSLQGAPQAAARYTECYLSKFSMDCIVGDMNESTNVVDWQATFDNHTMEPESLPVKVPLLLINGSFAIAIGRKIEVPKHSINDVIDATLAVLKNPRAEVVLIPDPCQKCEVICDDWKKISNTGYGSYIQRGIISIEHNNKTGCDILHILSVPDLIFSDTVVSKIEELMKNNKLVQVSDIQDHSTEDQLDIWVILKKGSDPEFVKQILYKNTSIQEAKRVNMEVIDGVEIKRMSYKAYIAYFLEYRRTTKFRLYNARLQRVETRMHEIDPYIRILHSGEIDKIIAMIRNQKSMDEDYLIEWLMNKLKITPLQAKFILNTRIKNLTKPNLQKYEEEYKELNKLANAYINVITHQEIIDAEIEQELIDIKKTYGKPRMSIELSESAADNIPAGEFKIVITEQNYIKKLLVNDPIRNFKGDNAKCILIGDNSKDILLFDNMGKVFRLPIHRVAFTDKNSPGIDIRMLIKKLTSNIISIMYHPIIEALDEKKSKYFLVIITKQGLIKKIDLADIINTIPSGIIYSKLNPHDEVADILIANFKSDIVMYNRSKALRISMDSIPYLKRTALGNIGMKSNDPIEGMSVITSETKEVIVVTAKGRFNKLVASALQRSDRAKAGNKVINLTKGDYILNIFPCINNAKIRITRADEVIEIDTASIPINSSVSSGVKLCKDGVIKAELIKI